VKKPGMSEQVIDAGDETGACETHIGAVEAQANP